MPAYSLGPDRLPLQPEIPADSYPFANLPQGQASPTTDSYRIQKTSQRRASLINPQAVARGIEADQRYQDTLLPQISPTPDLVQSVQINGSLHGHIDDTCIQQGSGNTDNLLNGPHDVVQGYTSEQDLKRDESGTLLGSSQSLSAMAHSQLHQLSYLESSVSSPASHAWAPALADGTRLASYLNTSMSCCHGENNMPTSQSSGEQSDWKNSAGNSAAYTPQRASRAPHEITQPTPLGPSFDPKEVLRYSPAPGNCSSYPERTTLYNLPPTYATASHPLNPTQLARFQQNLDGFSQTVPYHAPYGVTGSAAPSADGSNVFNPLHNCNCGDGCNCLGCAAHPYNATTRHHVQDLGQILEDGYANHPLSRPQSSYGSPINMIDVHTMLSGGASTNNEYFSSPATRNPQELAATPTNDSVDGLATLANLQSSLPSSPVYSSSSYYTMEFPMDSGGLYSACTDTSRSCQCGSNCACIGCLTHTGHDGDSFLDSTAIQQVLHQQPNLGSSYSLGVDMSAAPAPTPSRSSCCE